MSTYLWQLWCSVGLPCRDGWMQVGLLSFLLTLLALKPLWQLWPPKGFPGRKGWGVVGLLFVPFIFAALATVGNTLRIWTSPVHSGVVMAATQRQLKPAGGTTQPRDTTGTNSSTSTVPTAAEAALLSKIASQQDAIQSATSVLEERSNDQQKLVGALASITTLITLTVALVGAFSIKQNLQDAKTDLDKLETEVKADLEKLRQEIRADVPAIYGLNHRILALAGNLQAILPDDYDWYTEDSGAGTTTGYPTMSELAKQRVLLAEPVINALEIFASPDAKGPNQTNLGELNCALGRFYIGRYSDGTPTKDDLGRAKVYADKAVSLDHSAAAFRLRGLITLTPVTKAIEANTSPWKSPLLPEWQNSLTSAENDLTAGKTADRFDAGCYYNLAHVWIAQYQLEENAVRRTSNLRNAIRELESLRSIRNEHGLSTSQRNKYMANAYVDLACLRVLLAEIEPAATDALNPSDTVVALIKEASDYLNGNWSTQPAVLSLRNAVERELKSTGDFQRGPVTDKARADLRQIISSASPRASQQP